MKIPLATPKKDHPSHGPPSIEVNNSNGNHADSRSIEIYVSLLQKNLQVSCYFLKVRYFKGRNPRGRDLKIQKKTQKLIIEQRKTAKNYAKKSPFVKYLVP